MGLYRVVLETFYSLGQMLTVPSSPESLAQKQSTRSFVLITPLAAKEALRKVLGAVII
ncbi:MAG: hypothetical protein AAF728_20570 [Cyanobacteria bacterium P01_D01_bin.128]